MRDELHSRVSDPTPKYASVGKLKKKTSISAIGHTMFHGRSAEVAIRAALYLASRPPGELSPVRNVAKATKLPSPYLSKIIQVLAQTGLVRTFRGPGGGIELGKSPDAITLWSLVAAMDNAADLKRCAFGIGNCSSINPCPLHETWVPLRNEFQKKLEATTLATLLRELANTQEREPSLRDMIGGLGRSRARDQITDAHAKDRR